MLLDTRAASVRTVQTGGGQSCVGRSQRRSSGRHHLLHGPALDEFADIGERVGTEEPPRRHDPIAELVEELTAATDDG